MTKKIKESTTAGSVAQVATPLGNIQKRAGKLFKGKKTTKPFYETKKKVARTYQPYVPEVGRRIEFFDPKTALLMIGGTITKIEDDKIYFYDDATDHEYYVDKSKFDPQTLHEREITEQDLIIVPGQGHRLKPGFIPKDKDRTDHEVEMALSDLYQAAKNAKQLYEMIKGISEEQGLEGWVQEKIIKANDYLNTVREYMEHRSMMHEASVKQTLKTTARKLDPTIRGRLAAQSYDRDQYARTMRNMSGDDLSPEGNGIVGREERYAKRLRRLANQENPFTGQPKIDEMTGGVLAGGMSNFEEGQTEDTKSQFVAARYIDDFADGDHWYVKGTPEVIQRFVQLANSLEDEAVKGTEYEPEKGMMAKMHSQLGDDSTPQWQIVKAQNLQQLKPIGNKVLQRLMTSDLSNGVQEFISDFLWKLEAKGLAMVTNEPQQGVAEGRFDEPLTGWHIVSKAHGQVVRGTPSFETKEQAQKYLMTKMFANHQDYEVVHTGSVTEGYKNTFSIGDRVDGPLGKGTVVAVSKNLDIDGRVKVKLDDPNRAGTDGKYKDSFVLDTTQLKHIHEEQAPMFTPEEKQIDEKKDACYNKVKSRYKVWPSAYASGALVKCRKVGASNWGKSRSKANEDASSKAPVQQSKALTPGTRPSVAKGLGALIDQYVLLQAQRSAALERNRLSLAQNYMARMDELESLITQKKGGQEELDMIKKWMHTRRPKDKKM